MNVDFFLKTLKKDPVYNKLFKDPTYEEKEIKVPGYKFTKAISIGPKGGVPTVVFGPTLPYLFPLLEIGLEKLGIRVFWIPSYWEPDIIPQEIIEKLTLPKVIEDFENFRKVCAEAWSEVNMEKTLALGPSACGLPALLWAKQYPNSALGVLCLDTPLSLENFLVEQLYFLVCNYFWSQDFKALEDFLGKHQGGMFAKNKDPKYYNELTKFLGQLKKDTLKPNNECWKKIITDLELHGEGAKKGLITPGGQVEEYKRDETLYYGLEFPNENEKRMEEIYQVWEKTLNIAMRRKFFSLLFSPPEEGGCNLSEIKNTTVAVLFVRGVTGVVPCYLDEKNKDLMPENTEVYICPKGGHNPSVDDPETFKKVFVEWRKQNVDCQLQPKKTDFKIYQNIKFDSVFKFCSNKNETSVLKNPEQEESARAVTAKNAF